MENVAIVIGASSGIGEEISYKLAALQGKDTLSEIWLVARRKEKMESVAENIKNILNNIRVNICCGDITDPEFIKFLTNKLENNNTRINWLINSAGCGFYGNFDSVSVQNSCVCTDLNCTALVRTTASLLPFMDDGGRIIQLASGAAFFPQPGFAVYAASKSFVLNFSRALGKELSCRNITVTAVCPGPCDTEFLKIANDGKDLPSYKKRFLTTPDNVADKAVKASLKRRSLCIPSFSMKFLHVAGKVVPSNWIMYFQSKL